MVNTGKVVTPRKKRPRVGPVSLMCDDFMKDTIRSTVHSYFFDNKPPTVDKVMADVNKVIADINKDRLIEDELPQFRRTSFYKILREIGFEFVKRNQKSVVVDREDILLWRRDYLRTIRRYRQEGRKLYYLDETWVNEGHTVSKVWSDSTVKSKKHAFLSGLSTGLKHPSGKGKRLILLHIGSEDGFVEGGCLLFESRKSGDYHEEMTGEVFREWFENILPKLHPNSILVMDNAPYHSVKANRLPNRSWLKKDIIAWMESKEIRHEREMVKDELLRLVKEANNIRKYDTYVIDTLAQQSGFTILRLPPYHCILNPIEMIWSQVKGFVARNNTTFKLKDVKVLAESAMNQVSTEEWKNCIAHVMEEETKFWELDKLSDNVVDKLVINLGDDSNSDEEMESDMEGIQPLPDSE